jgi:hypothetical protein
MSNDDETTDRTRLDVFLKVERVADGYVETGLSGENTTYVRLAELGRLSVENLRVYSAVDPATGAITRHLQGHTREEMRAIGAEKPYKIFYVTLSSDLAPGTATIVKKYSLTGHSIHSKLSIGVSDAALNSIIADLGGAPTERQLWVALAKPLFYGRGPGTWSTPLLLPYWQDQKVSREVSFNQEFLVVEWPLSLGTITIGSTLAFRGDFAQPKSVSIHGPVSVQIPSDSGAKIQESEEQTHPLIESCERLINTLKGMTTSLYIIAAILVFILVKIWR